MLATISLTVALALCSCAGADRARDNPLLVGVDEPSSATRSGCQLAAVKCTRCHTVDRLLRARVASPAGWQRYVDRMRRMPGAAIGAADVGPILQCLVYRSFGDDGLARLEESQK